VVRKPFRQAELARAIELAMAAPADRRTEGLCGPGNRH
jgi:hypothetical protein